MKSAVIVFPGSNRDRDMIVALEKIGGAPPAIIWHKETTLPDADLYVIPGGFSYGDYLRSGAIAARSPIMQAVREQAARGAYVLGVCNGFQVLTEAGLLPGVLMRNASLQIRLPRGQAQGREHRQRCSPAAISGTRSSARPWRTTTAIISPIRRRSRPVEDNGQVAFRYAEGTNPNGSANDIAGVFNAERNVLGLMPHPEDLIEAAHGGSDGRALFAGLLQAA